MRFRIDTLPRYIGLRGYYLLSSCRHEVHLLWQWRLNRLCLRTPHHAYTWITGAKGYGRWYRLPGKLWTKLHLRASVTSTGSSVKRYRSLTQKNLFYFISSIIILRRKNVISFLQSWTDPIEWFLLPTKQSYWTLTTITNGFHATVLLYLLTLIQLLIYI